MRFLGERSEWEFAEPSQASQALSINGQDFNEQSSHTGSQPILPAPKWTAREVIENSLPIEGLYKRDRLRWTGDPSILTLEHPDIEDQLDEWFRATSSSILWLQSRLFERNADYESLAKRADELIDFALSLDAPVIS